MVELVLGPLTDALELAGIAAITGGILWATTVAACRMLDGRMRLSAIFESYRRHIGRESCSASSFWSLLTSSPRSSSSRACAVLRPSA